ncbi:hypothetical protein BCR35DRAFT_326126 [Leucosporidium creatinivorum]|uniref:TTI1 N-terminal TPR domain-containing protein n=1 Tax=Leucosporidium creatinivorum TaxID=106004 RepID=A0A1Y2ENT0_9BASI|nr:hypothetical protein BCR35DRAFT_326126 [Leucosporidium creatinivorum]
MAVPLFNAPGSRSPLSLDERKQQAFVQLKSICVPLLSTSRLPPSPSTTATLLSSLATLHDALSSIPDRVFSPPLANYAFFPLSSLLQPSADGRPRGDAVLEGTMRALGMLTKKWRICSDGKGMEDKIRTELWIMVALQLGGPLDPAGPGKGKGKAKEVEKTDESKLAMVEALLELMGHPKPLEEEQLDAEDSDDDDPLGEKIDWTADEPSPYPPSSTASATADQERPPPSAPPIPILFHTLTTLLSLAATPTSLVRLQLAALEALEILVCLYLSVPPPSPTASSADSTSSAPSSKPQGPSPLLATALPGTASTLSRIALSLPSSSAAPSSEPPRPQPSKVVVAALAALSELLFAAVGDEVTIGLRNQATEDRSKGVGTLEELVENFSTSTALAEEDDDKAGALLTTNPPPPEPTPLKGPTLPTPSWLAYTLSSVSSLLASLSPLSSHDSPLVRTALVDLLRQVLERAAETLSGNEGKSVLVEGLLVLSGDEWEQVGEPAREALRSALSSSVPFTSPSTIPGDGFQSVQDLVSSIVRSRLLSLPSSIRRQDDSSIIRSSKIIRVALDLLSSSTASSPLASAGLSFDKWSYTLLSSCDFERIAGAGADGSKGGEGKGMASAWITGGGSSLDGSKEAEEGWPTLRLRNVGDGKARRELERLWEAVGRSAGRGGKESEVVDFFVGVGVGRRWDGMGASAWWVVEGVLRG